MKHLIQHYPVPSIHITRLWRFGLSLGPLEYSSTQVWSPMPIEWRIAFRAASSLRLSLWVCLSFLRMCRSRLFLARLFLGMLFVMGTLYGLTTSRGDQAYAAGMNEKQPIKDRID